jgi:DNA-binding NarL/FixJ family response regulator
VRIVAVEDVLLVREGLARVLDQLGHELVAATGHPDDVPDLIAVHRPDVAILDIRLPPTHTDEGLRLAARLRADRPGLAVLVLSEYVVTSYPELLLGGSGGGVGYLLKQRLIHREVLNEALYRVAEGGVVVDPVVVDAVLAARRASAPLAALTDRERQVLRLMAEGRTDHGIAERLHVSLNTVGTHVRHIFAKLGVPETRAANRRVLAVLTFLRGARPSGENHRFP